MCLLTALIEITSVFKSNERKPGSQKRSAARWRNASFRPPGPGPGAGPLSTHIIVLQDVDIVQHIVRPSWRFAGLYA